MQMTLSPMTFDRNVTKVGFTGTALCTGFLAAVYLYRRTRYRWQEIEEKYGHEALHSIISHFKSLTLDPNTTVEEANKRRTVGYYEKARQAHEQNLVPGVWPFSALMKKRRQEMDRIMSYWNEGNKSHRTVIVMCDSTTSGLLHEARRDILRPLEYSTDISTSGTWIPDLSIIPEKDMHVTVAIPWWWHTIRDNNYELSKALASRFRQALVLDFHHPFQIELERIVLLGGKTLVALWRCVGERKTEDGTAIYDRHGESTDPFVKLRQEIVACFTTEDPDIKREPLTYTHKNSAEDLPVSPRPSVSAKRPTLKRQNTIEDKTPGLGQGDGFIHTTLCRLPLDCLSPHDVELEEIHRLCREATATYCGHRMVISKFRFLETTGRGGESNPCIEPIYDETIDAPSRLEVARNGVISETDNLHLPQQSNERSSTIGALPPVEKRETLQGLFDQEAKTLTEEEEGGDS